jgi:hypothetical protein
MRVTAYRPPGKSRMRASDPEPERALEDPRELFVLVRVPRHNASLVEKHVGEHHAVAGDELAGERIGDALERHIAPAKEADGVGHGEVGAQVVDLGGGVRSPALRSAGRLQTGGPMARGATARDARRAMCDAGLALDRSTRQAHIRTESQLVVSS